MRKLCSPQSFLILIGLLCSIFGKNFSYNQIPLNYLGYFFLTIGTLSMLGFLRHHSDTPNTNKPEPHTEDDRSGLRWLKGLTVLTIIISIVLFRVYQISIGIDLYIVNGFNEACTVEFENGKTIKVAGQNYNKLSLSSGDYQVIISKPDAPDYKQSFSLKQKSYLKSFFGYENTFVLNPYQGAVVEYAEVVYASKFDRNAGKCRSTYFSGSDFWVFDECDYPFKEMPEEISRKDTRTGLSLHTYADGELTYLTDFLLEEQFPPHRVLNLLETHIKNSYLNLTTIAGYLELASSKKRDISWIDAIADNALTNISFQRYYQNILIKYYGETFVQNSYRKKLEKNPDNPDLLYLTGRVDHDQTRALNCFKQALKINPEHAFSYFGIGYSQMMAGEFIKAKSNLEKAARFAPDSDTIYSALYDAKLASKDYSSLIEAQRSWNGDKLNSYRFYDLIELYNLTGQPQKAAGEVTAYHKRCAKEVDKANLTEYKATALVYNAYYSGDKTTMKRLLEHISDKADRNYYKFNYCLWCRQPNSAEMLLKQIGQEKSASALLLYIAYMRSGNKAKARTYLKHSISYYQKSLDFSSTAIADLLSGKASYRTLIEDIKRIALDPASKRELLVSLAIIYPYRKVELLALAEKFDYSLSMPHNFIKDSIKDLRLKKL